MYKRDFTWGPIVSNAEILAHPSQLRLRGRSRQTWYSWPTSSRRLHCRRREGGGAVSADVTFLPVQQPRRTADDGKGDRADVTFLPALQQTTGRCGRADVTFLPAWQQTTGRWSCPGGWSRRIIPAQPSTKTPLQTTRRANPRTCGRGALLVACHWLGQSGWGSRPWTWGRTGGRCWWRTTDWKAGRGRPLAGEVGETR